VSLPPILAALALAGICAACRVSPTRPPEARLADERNRQPRITVPWNATPLRSTNEILQIVVQAAREHRFPLEIYACESLVFEIPQGGTSNPNRWVAHFVREPPTPDSDFFILVEDATGRATLWHP
jgi:hypothetical protein